jgi:hypothetical protein
MHPPPTPVPVHLVLPSPLPVSVSPDVFVTLNTVSAVVAALAAVVAAYYAVETGKAALRALRRPRLRLSPSYRSSSGRHQIALTEDGNAAITFVLANDESNRATNVKVNLKIPGFTDAMLSGDYYIRLHLDGSGIREVGDVPPGYSFPIGAVVAKAPIGKFSAQWFIISNEGRWPVNGWHLEEFEVI